jgi:hypothetical protein
MKCLNKYSMSEKSHRKESHLVVIELDQTMLQKIFFK